MSRIGRQPIPLPPGVTVEMTGGTVLVKGPRGELRRPVHPAIQIIPEGNAILVRPRSESGKTAALWGLFRALVANMVKGVTHGFEKKLEFEGIGFRANLEADTLVLQLGFSHPVRFTPPAGIKLVVEKNTIVVSGNDKEVVGEVAARIRAQKPPEPYQGKGIRYRGEVIRRKAGKKAVASA